MEGAKVRTHWRFPVFVPFHFVSNKEAGMKTDDYFLGVQDHVQLKTPWDGRDARVSHPTSGWQPADRANPPARSGDRLTPTRKTDTS